MSDLRPIRGVDGEFRRWQFFTRFDIPSRNDPGKVYLSRLRVIQTPWFGIYLHKILECDTDKHLHDHPWPFFSLILWGGYIEELPTGGKHGSTVEIGRRWLSVGRRKATDLHRINKLFRTPTWTLVLVGCRTRRWGFQTKEGWVDYRTYFGLP